MTDEECRDLLAKADYARQVALFPSKAQPVQAQWLQSVADDMTRLTQRLYEAEK